MYPVQLNLANKHLVIIGGGKVAYRKFQQLKTESIASLTIVSQTFLPEFFQDKHANLKLITKCYDRNDIEKADIIIIATNDAQVNNQIKKDNKSYISTVFIAAVSISTLISLLIIIILVVYKTLNKKYSYSPVIAKELENNIAEMVEIPMVGKEIPVYDNPKKDGKIYIKPDINDLHG